MDFNLLTKLKSVKSFKRYYRLRGISFYQAELMYEEDGQIADVVKLVADLVKAKKNWEEIVTQLYKEKAIPKLFLVILKVYEPTFIHRWKNDYARNRLKIKKGEEVRSLLPKLHNSEVMKIVVDFFFINTAWLTSLLNIQNLLDLRKMMMMNKGSQ